MILTCDRSQPRQYGDDQGRYWAVSQGIAVIVGEKGYGSEQDRQRGTDIHQIFSLMLGEHMGWCDGPDIPEEYQGYANGIMQWIQQANPQPMMLERTLRHKIYPYAGTVDFVGMIGQDYGVLDLKTGTPEPWHSIQIHAYQKMLYQAAKMLILYVNSDGDFKQVSIKPSARDWAVFQNSLSILAWREA